MTSKSKKDDEQAPKYLGKYKVGSFIASGSFGKVYKSSSHPHLALKIMAKKSYYKEYGIPQDFIREIDIYSRLSHANIQNIEDIVIDEENIGLVQPLSTLGSLHYYLKKNTQKLSFEQRRSIAWQMVEGVEFFHNNNVVVVDLKPDNCLMYDFSDLLAMKLDQQHIDMLSDKQVKNIKASLSRRDSELDIQIPLLKITDMGGTYSMSRNIASVPHNTENFGTPGFSPPETYRQGTISYQWDIWSLAISLFEIMTHIDWRDVVDTHLYRKLVKNYSTSMLQKDEDLLYNFWKEQIIPNMKKHVNNSHKYIPRSSDRYNFRLLLENMLSFKWSDRPEIEDVILFPFWDDLFDKDRQKIVNIDLIEFIWWGASKWKPSNMNSSNLISLVSKQSPQSKVTSSSFQTKKKKAASKRKKSDDEDMSILLQYYLKDRRDLLLRVTALGAFSYWSPRAYFITVSLADRFIHAITSSLIIKYAINPSQYKRLLRIYMAACINIACKLCGEEYSIKIKELLAWTGDIHVDALELKTSVGDNTGDSQNIRSYVDQLLQVLKDPWSLLVHQEKEIIAGLNGVLLTETIYDTIDSQSAKQIKKAWLWTLIGPVVDRSPDITDNEYIENLYSKWFHNIDVNKMSPIMYNYKIKEGQDFDEMRIASHKNIMYGSLREILQQSKPSLSQPLYDRGFKDEEFQEEDEDEGKEEEQIGEEKKEKEITRRTRTKKN